MKRLRDNRADFESAIAQVSESSGLAPLFVEKDYWVSETLRALHGEFAASFILKGGTSLSKGYRLIERFSEDVDVIVAEPSGATTKTKAADLIRMTEKIATALGVEWEQAREPGKGKRPHRADVLIYPRSSDSDGRIAIEGRGVLLETGYVRGEWPTETITVRPLLEQISDLNPAEFEDVGPFTIRALKPVRTLVEKLSLLHHVASTWDEESSSTDRRCGRHYYDIYRLLDHQDTLEALRDRGEFGRMLGEAEDISVSQYGGWTVRPDGGYSASEAFSPPMGSELRYWLESRYNDAKDLLPSGAMATWPRFGQILKRVEQNGNLL